MKPVIQDIFVDSIEGVPGNCFQAAVASLLDLPLEGVPHFMLFEDNWFDVFVLWAKLNKLQVILETDDTEVPEDTFYILSGKSPRGNFDHAVIAYNGEMVHDPHPANAGVLTFTDAIWFEEIS